jgi:ketosteroid isomerase-like protein
LAERPNATRIRQAIQAFNQGQPGMFMDLMSDDVVFQIPGNSPIAGTYRGKAEVGGFFGHMAQLSEGSQQVELLHLLTGGDDLVAAVWKARGARKGRQYEGVAGYIFSFRDGKVVEATNLQQDQDEIDQFWSA